MHKEWGLKYRFHDDRTMKNSKWYARLRKLSVKWKIFLLSAGVFGLSLITSFAYFTYQSYWLNVTTALAGLMNFTDAKQQGVSLYRPE